MPSRFPNQLELDFAATDLIRAVLPGPSRKRLPQLYVFRLTYRNPHPSEEGCALLWQVEGGRQAYQVALEREENGRLRWHCTCADAIFRGEYRPYWCKHIRGLLAWSRTSAMKFETRDDLLKTGGTDRSLSRCRPRTLDVRS